MKRNNKCKSPVITQPADIILDFLNDEMDNDIQILKFYDNYIKSAAYYSTSTIDGTKYNYFDEDLVQIIRLAVMNSLPVLRRKLSNTDTPVVIFVSTSQHPLNNSANRK